jgi:hypothetical protein
MVTPRSAGVPDPELGFVDGELALAPGEDASQYADEQEASYSTVHTSSLGVLQGNPVYRM